MNRVHHYSRNGLSLLLLTLYFLSTQAFAASQSLFNNKDLSSTVIPFSESVFKQQAVSINTQLFSTSDNQDKLPDSLLISLFDEEVTVLFDKSMHVSKDSVSWIGHIINPAI